MSTKPILPKAPKKSHSFTIHGQVINDEYAWLRSKDWPSPVTEPDILDYLKAENNYYQDFIKNYDSQTQEIFDELKNRIKLTDQSTYTKKDDYYYYSRTEEKLNYPIFCRRKGSMEASEEVILDVNELAQGKSFTNIGAISVNPQHNLLAYSVDFEGNERYEIYIYDLENKQFLPDRIKGVYGNIIWHQEKSAIFYTPVDEKWRHNKLKIHLLGEASENDQLIFEEKNELFTVNIFKSSSKDLMFIQSGGHDSTETRFVNIREDDFKPKLICKRSDKVKYSVDHDGDYFYLHTNKNAENFCILRCKSDQALEQESNWESYIPEQDKYLTSFGLTKSYLLLNYKKNGLDELIAQDNQTLQRNYIEFPEAAYSADIYSTNFLEDDIRIGYSSLARPKTIYQYNFKSDRLKILKTQEIPSGHNPEEYKVERIFAKSRDGAEVPISLVYKPALVKKDGKNPLYLYGYGSYGLGISPTFRSSAISLANRGFVFAIAHIRGGDELGHKWYEAAKFLNKKRTFDDFICAAETLSADGYTREGQIVIAGGSAGGMLVGNVINQRPELFKAAIAHVPFVDVLNTMLDEDLPLTPGEFKEWGNPKEKEYFDYMKSYSPYDNVKKQNYPHLLVTAGLSDPRVGYWEAAKWVAKLREYSQSQSNVILLKTNMEYGHSGASGRFDYLKEMAEELCFVINYANES